MNTSKYDTVGLLSSNGTLSKFDEMSKKYDVITSTTGYDIYHDLDFEITKDYTEFMFDYNRMIHREIKANNPKGVWSLGSWIYYCDRAFIWAEPMMVVALKYSDIKTFTLVFWMYKTWYEERDNELTKDHLLYFIEGSPDEFDKEDLIKAIEYLENPSFVYPDDECDDDADDEYFELLRKAINKFLMVKLIQSGVYIQEFSNAHKKAIETVETNWKNAHPEK